MSPYEIETYLKNLKGLELEYFTNSVIEMFKETSDDSKRNSLALLLSEYVGEIAIESIIDMLKDEKTKKNRGTLIYSLRNLNYDKYFEFLFTLLFNNTFETKREVFILLEENLKNNKNILDVNKKYISILMKHIKILEEDLGFYISVIDLFLKK